VAARLQSGIAVAASLPGIHLGSPQLVDSGAAWELPVRLELDVPSDSVGQVTPWIARIDRAYPLGLIAIYPAQDGLRDTFQHQDPVIEGVRRSGKLCLDRPFGRRALARLGSDPVGDADRRLAWHLSRAREWLAGAAGGELVRPSDPFEIPRVVSSDDLRIIHDESASSFDGWRGLIGSFGQVSFRATPVPDTIAASRFMSRARKNVRTSRLYEDRKLLSIPGVWWLWPEPIVVPPWRAALSWKDLREAGARQGVDVISTLREIAPAARGHGRLLIMLGYPIPQTWGGTPDEVHWETIRLPELSKFPPRGFRAHPKALWRWERAHVFQDTARLKYVDTENWHPDRLQARGRLPEPLRTQSVAIIGCGALGSMIAELLARAGVTHLTLIDGDELVAGNLVRHVLTSSHLGCGKAIALAERLRQISPSLQIEAHETPLPAEIPRLVCLLERADLVLDCTASHEVPTLLSEAYWSIPKRFLSASFGFAAQRLFVFRSRGMRFEASAFLASVEPWLTRERSRWSEAGERLEGAGCYAPIFPARVDDVMGGAIAVVKLLEDTILNDRDASELVVLQAEVPYGGFRRIEKVEDVTPRLPHV
jgi:hypothetical protein